MDASSPTVQDGWVKAIYPGDGDGDPEAVPGVRPETEGEAHVPSFTLEVDGEVFALRSDRQGGTHYTWLSGPNPRLRIQSEPDTEHVAGRAPGEHPQLLSSD